MKRMACLLLAVAALFLVSCRRSNPTPTWEGVLENSGAALKISGAEVMDSITTMYPDDGSDNSWEVRLLTASDVPTLTWENTEAVEVTIAFAYAWDNCYRIYNTSEPIEKVDYVPLDTEEGSLCYRFDTAYSFLITVTTEQGTDQFVLDCRRDI